MNHIPTLRKTALDFAVLTTPNALHAHLTQQIFQPVLCSHQSKINQKIAVLLIRSGRNSKKRSPHFPTRYQIRKRMVSRREPEQSERNSRREQNGSRYRSNKKRLTGNSRQPFKLYHFKIVSCLYSISSNAVLFPL